MRSVIVLKGFSKMVIMELTSPEWIFARSYVGQLTYSNLFRAEILYVLQSYLKFEPEEISVELFMSLEPWPIWPNMAYAI